MILNKNITALLTGLLAGGVSYWFNSYSGEYFMGLHIYILLVIMVTGGSTVFNITIGDEIRHATLFISVGALAAVLMRIIYDITFWNSHSHNLALFEVLIALAIILPSAYIGASIGKWFCRQKEDDQNDNL